MQTLAPICLFTYKRLDCTIQTLEALQKNHLAQESRLYVFSDGPKKSEDQAEIDKVRAATASLKGFAEVKHVHRTENLGLARSIISGVSEVIRQHGKVIVMEDDLLTTPNFLAFMNAALDFYQDNAKVFSIGGYTIPIQIPSTFPFDAYPCPRHNPWGWASWRNRWETVDWEVKGYDAFKEDAAARARFNRGGSDLSKMLDKQMSEKLDSWAIRWGFQQFLNNQITILPSVSKVRNIGFGPDATHTKFYDRYRSELDAGEKTTFKFVPVTEVPDFVLHTYRDKYSLRKRFIGRLKHYLGLP
ncbi:MAG: glycosyltransferase [Microscillaceae bacterium]